MLPEHAENSGFASFFLSSFLLRPTCFRFLNAYVGVGIREFCSMRPRSLMVYGAALLSERMLRLRVRIPPGVDSTLFFLIVLFRFWLPSREVLKRYKRRMHSLDQDECIQ
jgi:hypothetical protein